MGKAIVCQEAECECQFGTMPDKIISISQHKQYVNDADGKKKDDCIYHGSRATI